MTGPILRDAVLRTAPQDEVVVGAARARGTDQGSTTLTRRPPRTSTRCIIEPPSISPPCAYPPAAAATGTMVTACHLMLVVTYQTPSGTRGKEKLPPASQRVVRSVET